MPCDVSPPLIWGGLVREEHVVEPNGTDWFWAVEPIAFCNRFQPKSNRFHQSVPPKKQSVPRSEQSVPPIGSTALSVPGDTRVSPGTLRAVEPIGGTDCSERGTDCFLGGTDWWNRLLLGWNRLQKAIGSTAQNQSVPFGSTTCSSRTRPPHMRGGETSQGIAGAPPMAAVFTTRVP